MRFVTWKEIKELGLVPYTRQYVGRLERKGRFPLRRRRYRRVVWVYDEIVAWQETKPVRGKSNGVRAPAKARYRLPDGSDWTGRGRIPLVLRDALKGAEGWDEENATFVDKESRAKALFKFEI